jgi:NADH-quinone oxidoreductase subunit H
VEFVTNHPVLVVSLVKIVVLMVVLMTVLAYLSWFERKIIAHIQSRWGPYYVGAHGLLQPLADGIKFLFKEDLTPPASDKFIFVLAPFLALTLSMTTLALIPFGPTVSIFGHPTQFVVANVDIG